MSLKDLPPASIAKVRTIAPHEQAECASPSRPLPLPLHAACCGDQPKNLHDGEGDTQGGVPGAQFVQVFRLGAVTCITVGAQDGSGACAAADVASMAGSQIQETWKIVEKDLDNHAVKFYEAMIEMSPPVRQLFVNRSLSPFLPPPSLLIHPHPNPLHALRGVSSASEDLFPGDHAAATRAFAQTCTLRLFLLSQSPGVL